MLSHMTDTDLNVRIGNHDFLQCNNITYLGVDIDNALSWDIQTDSISKKLVFIISRLSMLKPVLPSHMLKYIYTSIVQPKIDYAISIWRYTTAHNINKVQRLQNRAARILMGKYDCDDVDNGLDNTCEVIRQETVLFSTPETDYIIYD